MASSSLQLNDIICTTSLLFYIVVADGIDYSDHPDRYGTTWVPQKSQFHVVYGLSLTITGRVDGYSAYPIHGGGVFIIYPEELGDPRGSMSGRHYTVLLAMDVDGSIESSTNDEMMQADMPFESWERRALFKKINNEGSETRRNIGIRLSEELRKRRLV